GAHKGAVSALAFSPDGQWCVTGGEDKEICLWDTGKGTLRSRFPKVHRGAITSLHFATPNQVVSASHDNTIAVWQIGNGDEPQLARSPISSRSGEVKMLGVSPDGKRLLFDDQ